MRAYADDADALSKWIDALNTNVPSLRKIARKQKQFQQLKSKPPLLAAATEIPLQPAMGAAVGAATAGAAT